MLTIKNLQSRKLTDKMLSNSSKNSIRDHKICVWVLDLEKDIGYYETGCSNAFILNEGYPEELGMKYCMFCGKEIKSKNESNDG